LHGQVTHEHAGPTLEQIRELSELVTVTVDVADVQQTRIDGHVGGICAVLVVKGDVQVGVDLSAARFENIDASGKTAVLMLPEPTVSRPRLDHDRSHLFAVRQDGLWAITPGDHMYDRVTDRAWTEAQHTVVQAASDGKILERSRRHADEVLHTWFGAIGWEVTIQWPGRP
jgi:hypothetical protein